MQIYTSVSSAFTSGTKKKEKQGLEKQRWHHNLQIPLFLEKNSFTSGI
jgi:hypothetical protein